VASAKERWRIERDYQELKTEFGLDKYQGRGWRGFHHYWTLCIAAYAFVIAELTRLPPLSLGPSARSKSLHYPKVTDPAVLSPRCERHEPTSLTTFTIFLAQAILKPLPCCPYCRHRTLHPPTRPPFRPVEPTVSIQPLLTGVAL